jgi:hypothetical protein
MAAVCGVGLSRERGFGAAPRESGRVGRTVVVGVGHRNGNVGGSDRDSAATGRICPGQMGERRDRGALAVLRGIHDSAVYGSAGGGVARGLAVSAARMSRCEVEEGARKLLLIDCKLVSFFKHAT